MNFAARKAVQATTAANVWLYRRTNGRIGGRGMNGRPLLLLTVPGRRSKRLRTVPVVFFDRNGGYMGADRHRGTSLRQVPGACRPDVPDRSVDDRSMSD
jgi:hypothetical protein